MFALKLGQMARWHLSNGEACQLLTRRFVSQSALENILKELKERPETVLHSRRGIKRARDDFVDVETPYGKLLVEVPVKLEATKTEAEMEVRFPFVNPWAILYHL